MSRICVWFGLLVLILTWVGETAAERVDPFVASVPISDRTESARLAGFSRALEQVLIKASGDPAAVRSSGIDFGQARESVLQFSYTSLPDPGDPESEQLRLETRFDPNAVNRLMQQAALPVWPLERPTTIIWVVVNDTGQRRLLSQRNDDRLLAEALQQVAKDRGVPIVLPLLDLSDQQAVDIADIWGGFPEQLQQASARYGANAVVTLRVDGTSNVWRTRWALDGAGQSGRWSTEDESLLTAVRQGMDRFAGELAANQRVVSRPSTDNSGELRLRIYGIDSVTAYAQVQNYLQGLSVVKSATLSEAQGEVADFVVSGVQSTEALTQVISLDDILVAYSDPIQNRLESRLSYRYNR